MREDLLDPRHPRAIDTILNCNDLQKDTILKNQELASNFLPAAYSYMCMQTRPHIKNVPDNPKLVVLLLLIITLSSVLAFGFFSFGRPKSGNIDPILTEGRVDAASSAFLCI